MDYKELIGKLRQKDGCNCECLKAADAIETLLAERDKALEQLLDIQTTLDMYGGEYGITEKFKKAAERDAPVVHGKWESHLMPLAYKCSVCGYRPSAKEWRFHKRNFCPNCGAKMDLPNGE